jgi:RNA polymerase sigma factor (sigma-70 family)
MNSVLTQVRKTALLPDGGGLTDGQLLESFLVRREEAAFEMLVRRHGRMVLGVCQRVLGNLHDAEDAFQATFLVLVRKAAAVKPRELVANWLYGVAYRTAMKARTMTARRRAREKQAGERGRPETPQDDRWQELLPLLDQELARLPDRYRVPIVLCDLEGKGRKEVARRLQVPEGTLSSRLATARKMLARRLTRRGCVLSAGGLAGLLGQHAASACVPLTLVHSTTRAAMVVAEKAALAGAVSAPVAALTTGVLKAMFLSKLKIATVLLVALGVVGAGAFTYAALAGEQEPAKKESAPKAEQLRRHQEAAPAAAAEVDRKGPPSGVLKDDQQIASIAWSPDGQTLAGITHGDLDKGIKAPGAVKLWDLRTGSVKRTLTDAFSPFDSCVAFSPDGKTVAAGHTRFGDMSVVAEVLVWDAETGKLKQTLEHRPLMMRCVAFSPDGKWVASGSGGNLGKDFEMVKLWDVQTGKLLRSLDTTNKMAVLMTFSGNGKMLAVVAQAEDRSQEVMLWDPAAKTVLRTLGPEEAIGSMAFSSDGKTLVALTYAKLGAERQCTLKVWDVSTGELKRTHSFDKEPLRLWGVLSPDGRTIAHVIQRGEKRLIGLWDVKTGKLHGTLVNPPAGDYCHLAFSRDGKALAASSEDKTIIWGPRGRGEIPKRK